MMYIGVDAHKSHCQMTVMDTDGRVIESKKIPTKREELQSFVSRYKGGKAVVESSTIWEFVYNSIREEGIEVVLANPSQIKAIAQARVKTDKVDSEILAHLLRTNMIPESYVPPDETRELRKDLRGRQAIKELTTSLKNQIYAELIRKGIEYEPGFLGSKSGRNKARELLPIARVQKRIDILELLEEEMKGYNQELLLPKYDDSPQAQMVATLPGIGYYTALTVIGEIGEIDRFPDSSSLVSYAGLAPIVRQSSTTTRMGPISKAGPHNLRWVLTEAMHTHLRVCKDKERCQLCKFHSRVSRRRGKQKAIVAGAAKMLRIIYWMIKLNQPYRPQGSNPEGLTGGEPRHLD